MFVQLIEGEVADRDGLYAQMDRWERELRPGATGFLGSTGGVDADGRGILMACFDTAESAKRNSDRPEQGRWWAETEKCFEGPPSFSESDDIEDLGRGGSSAAGFVQIMKGTADRARVAEMDRLFEDRMTDIRPDVLGLRRVWTGPDTYVEAVYFTSEAEARQGEVQDMPADLVEEMASYTDLTAGIEYIDLTDPILSAT